MNKNLKITLSVDAKTGEVTAVRNSFDKLDRKVLKAQTALSSFHKSLLTIAGVTGAIYGLGKAVGFVVESGFEYNKAMDASRAKLTAMVSASKSYVTISGEAVDAMQRKKLVAAEVNDMMQILKTTNAQTAMGMSDLVDIYALAKPGMDKYKWAVKDQIEIVKLASNTASNFGMTAEELQSGIDDLAAGTWEASSGFGKMMKAIGVSKEEYKAAADKVAYLKEKMKETGAAQDTWAVAVSNFQVAWDTMAGQITQPVFSGIKQALKTVTLQMNTAGPDAMQVFSDALVSMVNGGISAVGTLIKWVSKLVAGFRIAYAGYKKLAGAARVWWNGSHAENAAKMEELKRDLEEAKKSGVGVTLVLSKIRSLKKDMKASDAGARLWAEADKDLEDIAAFDEKLQGVASSIKTITIPKGTISDTKEIVSETQKLAYKMSAAGDSSKKLTSNTKSHTKALKEAKKAAEAYAKGLKKAQDRLRDARLFNAGGDELVQIAKLGNELAGLGKYLKQSELAEIYEAEIAKMKQSTDSLADKLQEAFGIKNDSVFGHLFDNLLGSINAFGKAFGSGDPFSVANATGNLIGSSLDTLMPGLGTAVQTIGAMFSNTLSEAEIRAAAGRGEFESKGTQQIIDTLKKYQDPQLTATRQMLAHLESMDQNLLSALASSSSLNLSGSNFAPKTSSVLGGIISASTTELIGSGIKFYDQAVEGFVKGVEADKYEAIKKSSSILGIFHSEKIKEQTSKLPQSIAKQLGQAFQDGIDAAGTALDTLGLDTNAIEQKINEYVVNIGKVNLKDMSAEEQAKAINAALTEQLNNAVSGAINTIASPENISKLNSLRTTGEEYVQELVRIATEHETVRQQLALFGQTVQDFAASDTLVQAAGGLDRFKSAMDTFTKNFFSSAEQKQFMQQQLQYALQIHNVALPASKAQFRALVLETQQKIISVRATISTLKAEIAAKVAAGEMSLQVAYGELGAKGKIAQAHSNVIKGQISDNNVLIKSSHEAGKAAVSFGKSVHSSIQAMVTGVGQAAADGVEQSVDAVGGIDYSRITSPAIAAAQAELKNLEGLYGTLMSNMGDFAEYYNATGDSIAKTNNDAKSTEEKRVAKLKEAIDLINKEIKLRNALNRSIASMQDSVYGTFSQLMGKDIPKIVDNLYTAIADKNYEKVPGLFSDYAKKLEETANSKESYLRGIIGMNAAVQSVTRQDEMSLLDANIATSANTEEIVRLQRIATGIQADTKASTEKDNKLDRNIELLKELIALQKEANAQNAKGIEIQETQARDAVAAAYRAGGAA